jgi:3-hydroxyacyl-CoA dehydrogenase
MAVLDMASRPAEAEKTQPPPARKIAKVGVLGSGVMGSGIAAHVANAGVPVVLLDIVPAPDPTKPGATDRDAVAKGAIEKMRKTKPAPLMTEKAARLITPGNLEDHLGLLADCDWIVEVVVERLDVKKQVYAKVDAVRKPGSIVSSNTSTIPLAMVPVPTTPTLVIGRLSWGWSSGEGVCASATTAELSRFS